MEKQTIYISKNGSSKELAKQLYIIKSKMQSYDSCLEYEVFLCDESENEFLVYEKWSNNSSKDSVENENRDMFDNLKQYLHRKEILPVI